MSLASVITRGYGPPGSASLVVTQGYALTGEVMAPEPPATPLVAQFFGGGPFTPRYGYPRRWYGDDEDADRVPENAEAGQPAQAQPRPAPARTPERRVVSAVARTAPVDYRPVYAAARALKRDIAIDLAAARELRRARELRERAVREEEELMQVLLLLDD